MCCTNSISNRIKAMQKHVDTEMSVGEFVRLHGVACGGNWSAMLMAAIRNGMPETFAAMEDREYDFVDLLRIIQNHLDAPTA